MFLATFEQMLKLFLFLSIGFGLKRWGVFPENAPLTLSVLEVNLLVPSASFLAFYRNYTIDALRSSGILLLASVISISICCVIGFCSARLLTKEPYTRNILTYSICFPNTGYVGTPLALAMFGSGELMQMALFCLPFSFLTYTIGANMLLDHHGFSLKSLLNAPMVGMLLGIVCAAVKLPLPSAVTGVLDDCSGCVGPIAMILTGARIAGFRLNALLHDRLIYPTVLLRMVVVPLIILIPAKLIGVPAGILRTMVLVFSMPTGLNTVIFPASVGKNCGLGAGMACFANLFGIVSIPIMFYFFG